MFTGIIEEKGTVRRVLRGAHSGVLEIEAKIVLSGLNIGDSIAVNGVCLTVTAFDRRQFSADVMPETLSRSSLAVLSPGSAVNLERALPANGRLGGHIVSGHVDGMGTIRAIRREENAIWFTIQASPSLLRYIVEKGSVAIDGISLTVAKVSQRDFSVSVIPHTAAVTTLGQRSVGDAVNLETDIIGKYVEKLLRTAEPAPAASGSTLSLEFLARHGF